MFDSSTPTRVVIAGGSGFIGRSLAEHLTRLGMSVIVLSRRPPKTAAPWKHVAWDARSIGAWSDELDGAAALINLVGRNVDCTKTPDHQDEILRSRIEATRVLGLAVRAVAAPPAVWVQMSTAHIYGDPPEAICSEESPFGYGFAPFVGRAWEEEFRKSVLDVQRPVVLRTSFVIGRDCGAGGGALARLRTAVRLGLGGRVGPGTHGMSWIHEYDMNRIFERALTDASMRGCYVASAPNPVSQRVFMGELRRALGMPIGLPAAPWMVRLGAPLFLRTDPELALYGRYVVPKRLQEEGFVFQFPTLRAALDDLIRDRSSPQAVFPLPLGLSSFLKRTDGP